MKQMIFFLVSTLLCLVSNISYSQEHAALLPTQTVASVSVDSWKAALEFWDNPQFLAIADEERQYQDTDFSDQFGMTVETFGTLANGRVTRAMVSTDALTNGTTVIIADVDGEAMENWKNKAPLQKVRENLYSLKFNNSKKQSGTAFFLFMGERVALSQQEKPLAVMAEQIAVGTSALALAGEKDFSESKARLKPAIDNEAAVHFEWFSRPWSGIVLSSDKKEGDDWFGRHGLDSVSVLAGSLQQNKDSLTGKTAVTVLAKQPYRSTLGIFNPIKSNVISVPDWAEKLGKDGIVMQLDFRSATKNIATLFDDIFAEGIEGTYVDLLEDIKSEDGMGLDLDAELFAKLGPTLIYVGDETDKAWFAAIEVTDSQGVADVVQMLLDGDPDVSQLSLKGTDSPLWKMAGTDQMPDYYIHVSSQYLFYTSHPEWITRIIDGRSSEEMDQWLKKTSQQFSADDSRCVTALSWMKPDQENEKKYSPVNGMRGWFLGDYLESKVYWERELQGKNLLDSLWDSPSTGHAGSRGVSFQESQGGWTFYWEFQ